MCGAVLPPGLRPTYVEGNENNGNFLQKVPCMHCLTQFPRPCSRPLLTHVSARDSWTFTGNSGSVSWGHCSVLLGPGVHKVLLVPFKCLFPQSCISSRGSMVVLMVTSSKRAYVLPKSAALRAPAPAAGQCWPIPSQETLKHSFGSVSVVSLGPGVHKVCLRHLSISGG